MNRFGVIGGPKIKQAIPVQKEEPKEETKEKNQPEVVLVEEEDLEEEIKKVEKVLQTPLKEIKEKKSRKKKHKRKSTVISEQEE